MTKTTLTILAALVALNGAVACGSDDHQEEEAAAEEAMTGAVTSFGSELGELGELVEAHETDVLAAADLAAIGTIEGGYPAAFGVIHDELHGLLEHMAMCSHEGAAPHTEDLVVVLEAIEMEVHAHEQAMATAADEAEAAAEEARHQAEMATHLATTHSHHTELSADAGDYMCPMMDDGGHGH